MYSTCVSFVQTASSSRASELLGKEAGGGFIGFGAVSVGLAGTSNGGGKREELLQSSGAEFQVVMKQLGKKDPTTKLKVCVFVCVCACVIELVSLCGFCLFCPQWPNCIIHDSIYHITF